MNKIYKKLLILGAVACVYLGYTWLSGRIPSVQGAENDAASPGAHLPKPAKYVPLAEKPSEAVAVFAGGCFWCTGAVFEEVPGVKSVVSGYTGGDPKRADYKSVCTGTTGHAEGIKITYDASKLKFGELLRIFFATHDPTTPNQQGPDQGTQYRSAIFTADAEQLAAVQAYIVQLTDAKSFSKPITTTVEPLKEFFPAEEYHQDFMKVNPQHPYIKRFAEPKVKKVQKLLTEETPAQ